MIYNCYQDGNAVTLVHTIAGKMRKETILFKPSLFFKSKEGNFKSIYGEVLKRKFYSNTWAYNSSLYKLKEQEDETYFADIDPKYQYIANKFLNKKIEVDKEIKAYNYDIEAFKLSTNEFMKPELAKGPVQSITIQEMHTNKYFIFGYKDYEVTDIIRKDDDGKELYRINADQITYLQYKTEVQLLKGFVKFLSRKNVQVITGFNILKYDNQYIVNRLKRLGIEDEFVKNAVENRDGVHFGFMQNLDYQILYKKFNMGDMSSYSLNAIAGKELGLSKLDLPDGFGGTYKNNYKQFIDYNCIDVMLPYLLEKKLQYMVLVFTMSNRFRCLPIDVLSVTQYWDTYLYTYCLEKNIAVPRTKRSHKMQYMGGYVKEPIKGLSGWQTLYDIESSYPTNNRNIGISTETLIEYENLPEQILNKVINKLFKTFKKVYDENKNKYKNKSGTVRILKMGQAPKPNQHSVLYLKSEEDDQLIHKVPYPRFFMINDSTKVDNKKMKYCKRLTTNDYLYYAMNKADIVNVCNKQFKNYSSVRFVDHALIHKYLVDEFVEDPMLFEEYTELLNENKLVITPILQFFKKTKKLGILARTQELVFFDRKIAKKATHHDDIVGHISKQYLEDNMKVDKDKILKLGMNLLPKQMKEDLIKTLRSKNKTKIHLYGEKYIDLSVVDEIINQALKIAINGAYGATANENFRWSDVRLSESTTSCGQLVSRGLARYLEQKGVIQFQYEDTDSILLSVNNEIINKYIKNNIQLVYNNKTYFLNPNDKISIKRNEIETQIEVKNLLQTDYILNI